MTISLVPLRHGVLDPGGRDRVVHGRVGADDDHHLGLGHVHHRVGHRARADAFEQGRHRRGVAQARAMVDVVAAEAGAHQLLEQVGFFVAALGRAEAGQRLAAVAVADLAQPAAGEFQRFFPGGFAEDVHHALRDPSSKSPRLGASARRISGTVRRCGWWA